MELFDAVMPRTTFIASTSEVKRMKGKWREMYAGNVEGHQVMMRRHRDGKQWQVEAAAPADTLSTVRQDAVNSMTPLLSLFTGNHMNVYADSAHELERELLDAGFSNAAARDLAGIAAATQPKKTWGRPPGKAAS